MNIFFAIADTNACGYLRMIQPALYLRGMYGHNIEIADRENENMNIADIVVLQRTMNEKAIHLTKILRANGKKVVYELDDDFWHLPYYNQHQKVYNEKNRIVERIISECDAVTVSTKPLADVVRKWNRNVAVLPNCMEFAGWMDEARPQDRNTVRIGWTGGYEHGGDLDLVVGALKEIKEKYGDRVELAFLTGSGFPEELVGIAEHYPFVPFENYLDSLRELRLDIGVLPLVDNTFNISKSNLKYLDLSALHIASIASPVYPYATTIEHGVTGLLVKKNRHAEWVKALSSLIDNHAKRCDIAENANQFVKDNFDIRKNVKLWDEFYRGLM